MAGVFPYRGPGTPVPGPLAPLPDYMSEEKLQEKGEGSGRIRLGSGVLLGSGPLGTLPQYSLRIQVLACRSHSCERKHSL